ncbi:Uncharacterised protein [Mycobacterium tuberculosis]|nr:Uncharacterised protein [Mycobacterium tuberculosis]
MICTPSSRRPSRSPAGGKPYPYARHSCSYQPPPIPIWIRPPEMMSEVAATLARYTGLR